MGEANKCPNVEWVAVCDAWDLRRDKAAQLAGGQVEKYAYYHQLLDRKDIDGVIVATWDNLHPQVAADACRAGRYLSAGEAVSFGLADEIASRGATIHAWPGTGLGFRPPSRHV